MHDETQAAEMEEGCMEMEEGCMETEEGCMETEEGCMETEEGCMETEEGSMEAQEAVFVAVDESLECYPVCLCICYDLWYHSTCKRSMENSFCSTSSDLGQLYSY